MKVGELRQICEQLPDGMTVGFYLPEWNIYVDPMAEETTVSMNHKGEWVPGYDARPTATVMLMLGLRPEPPAEQSTYPGIEDPNWGGNLSTADFTVSTWNKFMKGDTVMPGSHHRMKLAQVPAADSCELLDISTLQNFVGICILPDSPDGKPEMVRVQDGKVIMREPHN